MNLYTIHVTRKYVMGADVKVQAESEEEAQRKAMALIDQTKLEAEGPMFDFNEGDGVYVMAIEKVRG